MQSKELQSHVRKQDGKIIVEGHISALPGPMKITWKAAAPNTRGISFSGSGLPHPNVEQAFDVRAMTGSLNSPDGTFRITLDDVPGAYYAGLGSIYIPPHVQLEVVGGGGERWNGQALVQDFGAPFRWISGAPPGFQEKSQDQGRAMFYKWNPDSGVRSQETILRSRGYPAMN